MYLQNFRCLPEADLKESVFISKDLVSNFVLATGITQLQKRSFTLRYAIFIRLYVRELPLRTIFRLDTHLLCRAFWQYCARIVRAARLYCECSLQRRSCYSYVRSAVCTNIFMYEPRSPGDYNTIQYNTIQYTILYLTSVEIRLAV